MPAPEVGGLESAAAAVPDGGRPRFPLFDSLRGIAALCVVVTHSAFVSLAVFLSSFKGFLAHLNVGVTIFFLISGFLLYRPYVAARATGRPGPDWQGYAKRRFLRIAPAYWVALTGLAVFPGLFGVFTGNWWVYYGLLQPYPIYKAGTECFTESLTCGIAQSWSLSIEVAFYVALPLYAAVMSRVTARAGGRSRLVRDFWVLVALAAASVAFRMWGLDHPSAGWLYGTIAAYFLWFAMGMGLAVASVAGERRGSGRPPRAVPGWVHTASWAAAIALFSFLALWLPATAAVNGMTRTEYFVEHIGLGLVALLLLLPAVFGGPGSGIPGRLLANPVLSWFGRISYGVFLWHLSVLFYVADHGATGWLPGNDFVSLTVVTTAVSVVLAALSYYLVELPLMRWSRRSRTSGRPPAPAVSA